MAFIVVLWPRVRLVARTLSGTPSRIFAFHSLLVEPCFLDFLTNLQFGFFEVWPGAPGNVDLSEFARRLLLLRDLLPLFPDARSMGQLPLFYRNHLRLLNPEDVNRKLPGIYFLHLALMALGSLVGQPPLLWLDILLFPALIVIP